MSVVLIGTLDTKGREVDYVRQELRACGVETLVIDAGVKDPPVTKADIPRETVFEAAGTTLAALQAQGDRGTAVTAAAEGVRIVILDLFRKGQVSGVLALGGSAGTTISTSAMRALPFGVPKLMVSTLASGNVRPFVGATDIVMMHSVTDISGINRISRTVLRNAAHAMAGMVTAPTPAVEYTDKPLLTATMFGVTTRCVEQCRSIVEDKGYETLVFHAVGTGGQAMESLIDSGLVNGVLDITTTELADELVGGVLSAGPSRLTAAGRCGIPQVISVGALDMVNFGPRPTVPQQFEGRKFHIHNENVTLMRTTPAENEKLGREIAAKASAAAGPTAVFLPLRGVSAIDAVGQPFWDPDADASLFRAIRDHLKPPALLVELDAHINDMSFAKAVSNKLLEMLDRSDR
jgi:uncharacterized protein (UPF0261 family)